MKDQLLFDKMIIKNSKSGKNMSVTSIDYKKAFDMIPHSWLIECLQIYSTGEYHQHPYEHNSKLENNIYKC